MIVGGLLGDDSKGEADGLEKRVDGWMDGTEQAGGKTAVEGGGGGGTCTYLPYGYG